MLHVKMPVGRRNSPHLLLRLRLKRSQRRLLVDLGLREQCAPLGVERHGVAVGSNTRARH